MNEDSDEARVLSLRRVVAGRTIDAGSYDDLGRFLIGADYNFLALAGIELGVQCCGSVRDFNRLHERVMISRINNEFAEAIRHIEVKSGLVSQIILRDSS